MAENNYALGAHAQARYTVVRLCVCVNAESESYSLMERGAYTTAAI